MSGVRGCFSSSCYATFLENRMVTSPWTPLVVALIITVSALLLTNGYLSNTSEWEWLTDGTLLDSNVEMLYVLVPTLLTDIGLVVCSIRGFCSETAAAAAAVANHKEAATDSAPLTSASRVVAATKTALPVNIKIHIANGGFITLSINARTTIADLRADSESLRSVVMGFPKKAYMFVKNADGTIPLKETQRVQRLNLSCLYIREVETLSNQAIAPTSTTTPPPSSTSSISSSSSSTSSSSTSTPSTLSTPPLDESKIPLGYTYRIYGDSIHLVSRSDPDDDLTIVPAKIGGRPYGLYGGLSDRGAIHLWHTEKGWLVNMAPSISAATIPSSELQKLLDESKEPEGCVVIASKNDGGSRGIVEQFCIRYTEPSRSSVSVGDYIGPDARHISPIPNCIYFNQRRRRLIPGTDTGSLPSTSTASSSTSSSSTSSQSITSAAGSSDSTIKVPAGNTYRLHEDAIHIYHGDYDMTIVAAKKTGSPWGLYALDNRCGVLLWNRDENSLTLYMDDLYLRHKSELDKLFAASKEEVGHVTIGQERRSDGIKSVLCYYCTTPPQGGFAAYIDNPNLSQLPPATYIAKRRRRGPPGNRIY